MEHDRRPMRPAPCSGRRLARRRPLAAALLAECALAPAAAATPAGGASRPKSAASATPGPLGKIILQWDHLIDSDDRTFEDYWGFLSYKQMHVQAWDGEFTKGGEIGGFLRDHRRSTYSAFYRYRKDFDHVVELDTEQVLKKGFVLAGILRGIHVIPDNTGTDRDQLQYGSGFDYYWGDYDFFSFRAISDPRAGGRWSFVSSARLQYGEPIYVQPGIVKHTDGSTGWFVNAKYKMLRLSAGKYNQFDWTETDRTIYSVGLEWTY